MQDIERRLSLARLSDMELVPMTTQRPEHVEVSPALPSAQRGNDCGPAGDETQGCSYDPERIAAGE